MKYGRDFFYCTRTMVVSFRGQMVGLSVHRLMVHEIVRWCIEKCGWRKMVQWEMKVREKKRSVPATRRWKHSIASTPVPEQSYSTKISFETFERVLPKYSSTSVRQALGKWNQHCLSIRGRFFVGSFPYMVSSCTWCGVWATASPFFPGQGNIPLTHGTKQGFRENSPEGVDSADDSVSSVSGRKCFFFGGFKPESIAGAGCGRSCAVTSICGALAPSADRPAARHHLRKPGKNSVAVDVRGTSVDAESRNASRREKRNERLLFNLPTKLLVMA